MLARELDREQEFSEEQAVIIAGLRRDLGEAERENLALHDEIKKANQRAIDELFEVPLSYFHENPWL